MCDSLFRWSPIHKTESDFFIHFKTLSIVYNKMSRQNLLKYIFSWMTVIVHCQYLTVNDINPSQVVLYYYQKKMDNIIIMLIKTWLGFKAFIYLSLETRLTFACTRWALSFVKTFSLAAGINISHFSNNKSPSYGLAFGKPTIVPLSCEMVEKA